MVEYFCFDLLCFYALVPSCHVLFHTLCTFMSFVDVPLCSTGQSPHTNHTAMDGQNKKGKEQILNIVEGRDGG